jgi:hypothetical protein
MSDVAAVVVGLALTVGPVICLAFAWRCGMKLVAPTPSAVEPLTAREEPMPGRWEQPPTRWEQPRTTLGGATVAEAAAAMQALAASPHGRFSRGGIVR